MSKTERSISSVDEGVIDKVKGISMTPTISTLLKPSADYLAQELKEYLKTKIESYKERKRSENISEHLKHVFSRLEKEKEDIERPPESLEQLELFEEWVSGAQDVDPKNEILSSMWRKLLSEIIRGNVKDDLLISILKRMDSYDAKLLMRFKAHGRYKPDNKEEKYYLRRLKQLELIEEKIGHWAFFLGITYIPLMYLTYKVATNFTEAPKIGALFEFLSTLFPQVGISLAISAIIAWIIYRLVPNQGLSWLGEELIAHVAHEDIEKVLKLEEEDSAQPGATADR
jgi:hypothetical protein